MRSDVCFKSLILEEIGIKTPTIGLSRGAQFKIEINGTVVRYYYVVIFSVVNVRNESGIYYKIIDSCV